MASNYLTLLFNMARLACSHACLHMFMDNAKQVLLHVSPCAWNTMLPTFPCW